MKLAWDHWHIEPSSICTLQCPRCPRAEVPETLLNRQLTLDFFVNQIGQYVAGQIKKITFCGNDGDPIYCKDLIEICHWLKTVNPNMQLVIITNGSYKPESWWESLAKVLDHHDEIHWSLDGWDQHSNNQYRINSNWQSIMLGIGAFFKTNSSTYRVWASIAFRFNQDQIDHQKDMAAAAGFDCYQLTLSTKFGSKYPGAYGSNDPLEPSRSDLISKTHRFERRVFALNACSRPGQALEKIFFQRAQDLDKHTTHSGICLIGNKGVFLNSRGEFYPCCWTANRYEHNHSWHTLAATNFNLNQKTFSEIIQDPFWSSDFLRFNSQECKTKCTREQLKDIEHVTKW